jgi:hypothetical protein
MGFTINEPITISRLGVTVPNAYVTIKGSFTLSKGQFNQPMYNMPGINLQGLTPKTYNFYTTYYVYSSNTAGLDTLQGPTQVLVSTDTYPDNINTFLYNYIKEKYPGNTFVDC